VTSIFGVARGRVDYHSPLTCYDRAVPRARTGDPLNHLREICLVLPEAVEKETWGEATFRVRDKIFAMAGVGDSGVSMSCKAPPGVQEMLVGSDAKRFYRPAYVGHRGWVGVRLDAGTDWDQVADLIEDSYRMTAPKRVSVLLDETRPQ